jgi:hypothetical protein
MASRAAVEFGGLRVERESLRPRTSAGLDSISPRSGKDGLRTVSVLRVCAEGNETTIKVRYAGPTATSYLRLSDAGFAPEVVSITDDEIEAVRHCTLSAWLEENPSPEARAAMAVRIRDLLRAVHENVVLCHRDVHVDNIVVAADGRPLLIDPALATPSVNEYCYDLEGPSESDVPVPEDHVRQGYPTEEGVWWGSPVRHRSLLSAFGPPPTS